MGFESSKRFGRYWEDAKQVHQLIHAYPFNTSGKSERDFENGFATSLIMAKGNFKSKPHTQIDKDTTVGSVFCFGKQHRPDMALGDSGSAIELKHITYAGLKDAIGQGVLYRLRYRFTFLILIVSNKRKHIYYDISTGKEKDLIDTLHYLADNLNIFTYVVPAFKPTPGCKHCYSFFEPIDEPNRLGTVNSSIAE